MRLRASTKLLTESDEFIEQCRKLNEAYSMKRQLYRKNNPHVTRDQISSLPSRTKQWRIEPWSNGTWVVARGEGDSLQLAAGAYGIVEVFDTEKQASFRARQINVSSYSTPAIAHSSRHINERRRIAK